MLLLFHIGHAQKNGFIVKGDTAYALGKVRFYPGMFRTVEFSTGKNKYETFDADQLSEFGYDDSTKFISKKIWFADKHQQAFLELIEEGNVSLYRLQAPEEIFFLETDSLVLVRKNELHQYLKAYSDPYQGGENAHKLVRYEKRSLSHYIRNLNTGKSKPTPFTSYGPVIRFTSSKIMFSDDSYIANKWGSTAVNTTDLQVGLFVQKPVWKVNNLSIHSQLLLGKQKLAKELISPFLNEDVIIEQSNLQLDISPVYSLSVGKLKPYAFLGGNFTYSLRSNSYLFQAHIKDNVITFEKNSQFIEMPEYYYGFNLGTGIQLFYTYNRYIALEIGHTNLYSNKDFSVSNNFLSIKGNL
ncbi:hypothetical protein D770_06800 [Flammeovirgaceae bacterium 311]|nr:hypothetical protein D770_06800 [Flammeovirgaceae bacterium 311]